MAKTPEPFLSVQYLDIMDEYLLFQYLLFNIHFSRCTHTKKLTRYVNEQQP